MNLDKRPLALASVALALGIAGSLVVQRVRAAGVPTKGALTYSGYLALADGALVNATKDIALLAYDSATGGTLVCQVISSPVSVVAGRFQLSLSDTCATAIHASADIWIDIQVEGASLGRTKIGATPYALEAGNALSAATAASATNARNAANAANAALFAGNAPESFQRTLKGTCSSGIASIAADGTTTCNTFGVFRKNGNNGSVSCSTFCNGSQWGGASYTGTCVGARKTTTLEWVACDVTNFVDNAQNLDCWCSRPTD